MAFADAAYAYTARARAARLYPWSRAFFWAEPPALPMAGERKNKMNCKNDLYYIGAAHAAAKALLPA
jgi:hypothetical protein